MANSLKEKKRKAEEMLAFLEAIPASKEGPLLSHDPILLDSLERSIGKLKAFLIMLSKVNFIKWMMDAYANYKGPTKTPVSEPSTIQEKEEDIFKLDTHANLEKDITPMPPLQRGPST